MLTRSGLRFVLSGFLEAIKGLFQAAKRRDARTASRGFHYQD
jgi:hypothetical protein